MLVFTASARLKAFYFQFLVAVPDEIISELTAERTAEQAQTENVQFEAFQRKTFSFSKCRSPKSPPMPSATSGAEFKKRKHHFRTATSWWWWWLTYPIQICQLQSHGNILRINIGGHLRLAPRQRSPRGKPRREGAWGGHKTDPLFALTLAYEGWMSPPPQPLSSLSKVAVHINKYAYGWIGVVAVTKGEEWEATSGRKMSY